MRSILRAAYPEDLGRDVGPVPVENDVETSILERQAGFASAAYSTTGTPLAERLIVATGMFGAGRLFASRSSSCQLPAGRSRRRVLIVPGRPAGDLVLVTQTWRDRLWSAVPHRLVRSSPGEVVTFVAAGTRGSFATSRGIIGRERLSRAERKLEALRSDVRSVVEVLLELDMLNFFVDDSWARTNLAWANGRFVGWYVNFELPPTATPEGIATMDLVLDALVTPAGEWQWKDRDDFDRAVSDGLLDPTLPHTLAATAATIQELLKSGEGPFHPDWVDWSRLHPGRFLACRRSTQRVVPHGGTSEVRSNGGRSRRCCREGRWAR